MDTIPSNHGTSSAHVAVETAATVGVRVAAAAATSTTTHLEVDPTSSDDGAGLEPIHDSDDARIPTGLAESSLPVRGLSRDTTPSQQLALENFMQSPSDSVWGDLVDTLRPQRRHPETMAVPEPESAATVSTEQISATMIDGGEDETPPTALTPLPAAATMTSSTEAGSASAARIPSDGPKIINDDSDHLPVPFGMTQSFINAIEGDRDKSPRRVEHIEDDTGPYTPADMFEDPDYSQELAASGAKIGSPDDDDSPDPLYSAKFEDKNKEPSLISDIDSIIAPPNEEMEDGLLLNTNDGNTVGLRGWNDIAMRINRPVANGPMNTDLHVDEEEVNDSDINGGMDSYDQTNNAIDEPDSRFCVPVAWPVVASEDGLTEDGYVEVVVATQAVPWWKQRRTRILLCTMFVIVAAFTTTLVVVFSANNEENDPIVMISSTLSPSIGPSQKNDPIVMISSTLSPSISPSEENDPIVMIPSTLSPSIGPSEENDSMEMIPSTLSPSVGPTRAIFNHFTGCYGNDVNIFIEVQTDQFFNETSWELLNPDSTQVLHQDSFGILEYKSSNVCVPHGKYTFIIKDTYGDGICCGNGEGFFRIHINGREVRRGDKFGHTVTVILNVGGGMTERDFQYLEAHNVRRKDWHERYNVTYVPMMYSSMLAQASQAWAEELASSCDIGLDPFILFGENVDMFKRSSFETYSPNSVLERWVDSKVGLGYPRNQQLTQVLWRATKYLGCGESVQEYDGSACHVQVCWYARAGNCGMGAYNASEGENWLIPMLKDYTGCGPDCPPEGCF